MESLKYLYRIVKYIISGYPFRTKTMKSVTTIIAYAILRAKTLYKLDEYAGKIGMYTSYRIHDNETVGSTNRTVEEIVNELRKIGYEYNPQQSNTLNQVKSKQDLSDMSPRNILS